MGATKGICQAGGMRGLADHRSGLVQEIFRVIDECPSVYLIFKLLSANHVRYSLESMKLLFHSLIEIIMSQEFRSA